jgi:hypothetical protein
VEESSHQEVPRLPQVCLCDREKGKGRRNEGVGLRDMEFFSSCFNRLIQKNGGCDHMTCKCGYEMCWRCGKVSGMTKELFFVACATYRLC